MNRMYVLRIRQLFAATLGSALIATAVCAAPQSQVVRYSDLNVATSEGASALYTRLKRAAEVACDEAGSRAVSAKRVQRACVEETLARAIRDTGVDELIARHRAGGARAHR